MDKKKLCLVGCGPMGMRHVQSIALSKKLELVAACDFDAQKKDSFTKDVFFSTDLQNIFNSVDFDGIIVATNGPSHYEIVLRAIDQGVKNIFCEKPIATSLTDAEQMYETSKQKNVRLSINHARRWMPSYTKLKSLIDSKVIGDIKHFSFQMAGGQLASNGGHFWDLVRFLTNQEFSHILGFLDSEVEPNPRGKQFRDPGGFGVGVLNSGCRVFFDMVADYSNPFFLEIMGSHGRILIDEKSNDWKISSRTKENWDLPLSRRTTLEQLKFNPMPVDMIQASQLALEELMSNALISCNAYDGFKSLEVSVAVHESENNNNTFIHLPVEDHSKNISYPFT